VGERGRGEVERQLDVHREPRADLLLRRGDAMMAVEPDVFDEKYIRRSATRPEGTHRSVRPLSEPEDVVHRVETRAGGRDEPGRAQGPLREGVAAVSPVGQLEPLT